MKELNVTRLMFWLAVVIGTGFLVQDESAEGQASMPGAESGSPLVIMDQNGRTAVSGPRSSTSTTVDVMVAPGGTLTFSPSTVNISVGDTVRWTWAASGHSVTSGNSTSCISDGQFCSPNNTNCTTCVTSNVGFVYEFTFTTAGNFSYFCCRHCAFGMIGAVNVSAAENIVLAAHGKVMGGINVSRLMWTGASASTIDVKRGGVVVATVPNTGRYIDSTGTTGRQSFVYQVCDAGTSTCSNQVTVNFR
jgi:plastocyanin